jgi:hypothetical protein
VQSGVDHSYKHCIALHRHRCPICDKRFARLDHLKLVHMPQHAATAEPSPFVCRTCHKGFKVKGRLERHQILHSGTAMLHQCHSSTQSLLGVHGPMCACISGKVCSCAVCCQSEPQQGILKLFLTGQKNHHCPICDKAFALDVYLKSHLKTHEKQDGYIQCPKCPRKFASKETLQVTEKFKEYEIQLISGSVSTSELYRPSDRRLLAKSVPAFTDRGVLHSQHGRSRMAAFSDL